MYVKVLPILLCLLVADMYAEHRFDDFNNPLDTHTCIPIRKYKLRNEPVCYCRQRRPDAFAYNIGRDIVSLFAHIWDWDTLKVLITTFPFFIATRWIDEEIQQNFFCHRHHKNMNQFPHWCQDVAKFGLGIPIVLLGSQAFLSKDYDMRYTSWMLLLGMPFVLFGKDVIKNFNADCCLRPWHEDFCKNHRRCPGGFPSGHMAQAVYIATLYGYRYGAEYAIPLGIYAAGLGAIFINCNRHYLSQIVAGAALGVIFGIAANKVVDHRVAEKFKFQFGCDSSGSPSVGISCTF